MGLSSLYVAISIAALAVVAVLVFVVGRGERANRLTPRAGLAFVVAGIVFGDNRLIGYGLMGVGVILAMVNMLNQAKRKQPACVANPTPEDRAEYQRLRLAESPDSTLRPPDYDVFSANSMLRSRVARRIGTNTLFPVNNS